MASAYGPRIVPFAVISGGAIPDQAEIVVGSVVIPSTTEVTDTVWVHAFIEVHAGPDATGVQVKIYRGDLASGTEILLCNFISPDFADADNAVSVDQVDFLGPQVVSQLYTVTISVPAMTDPGGLGDIVIIGTVF